MRKLFSAFSLGVVSLSLGLVGCEDSYSSTFTYAVRKDPLVLGVSEKLGKERFDPDRPGILPLSSPKDITDPFHPMKEKETDLLADVSAGGVTLRDPMLISTSDRAELDTQLTKVFGTPREPKVGMIEDDVRKALSLDDASLKKGSDLYRIHCLHCHGVTGDGRGPTGRWVNPHPRDFRQMLFKFQSTDQSNSPASPRREDLLRTLKNGIEGTAMPSFNLLPAADLDLMTSYVIHLSIRGRDEFDTFRSYFEFDQTKKSWVKSDEQSLEEYVTVLAKVKTKDWLTAQTREIKVIPNPVPSPTDKESQEKFKASVINGQKIFWGAAGKKDDKKGAQTCVSCHKDYGRQATYAFDSWGTLVRPNNLTQGVYRGGRRPVDIYYRIHSGINGSGMPSFGASLKSNEIWDLVNFIRVLPYPAMRKELGLNLDQPLTAAN